MKKIVEWVVTRMGALEWTIQKYLSPSIFIQDTKKSFQWLIFLMDLLNGKTKLLKQIHILKDHLNEKTGVVETNTHSNGFSIPMEWNW